MNKINMYNRILPFAMMAELMPPEQHQPRIAEKVPGRNELCSCGSGLKYKKMLWKMKTTEITSDFMRACENCEEYQLLHPEYGQCENRDKAVGHFDTCDNFKLKKKTQTEENE